MKSALKLGSLLLLVPTLFLAACSGAESEGDADLGEVSLAQKKSPTQGGSCTITTCAGTKDPFGSYSCDKNGNCSCVRGGTTSTCDANGENCKENGCPTPPPATAPNGGGLTTNPAADTVAQDPDPIRFRFNAGPSEVAP